MRPENVPATVHALDRFGRTLAFRTVLLAESAPIIARSLLADLEAADIFTARLEYRAPNAAMVESWTPGQLVEEARA
ncbi:MAG TPA: hypothetical protein VMX33_15105 [bacterium]|nr:hypothetical protein [bacterium]